MKKILALTLLVSSSFAIAQTPKLTIDDLLGAGFAGGGGFGRGRGAEGPKTPDGKFTVGINENQIVLRPVDGGDAKILTNSPEPKQDLQLSPDGTHIAYVSKGQIWVVATDGSAPLQLTSDPKGLGDPRGATDQHPQWNPNGTWILYESGTKGFNEIYVTKQDGSIHNLLAATEIYHGKDVDQYTVPDRGDAVSSDRFDARPQWSPDGTRISFTERSREFFSGKLKILKFDQETGKPAGPALDIYVANNDPGGAWAVNTAAWSPDSSTLALVLQETHWDKIWLVPAAGGAPRELTFGIGEDEEPVYSPDGQWIEFESNRGIPEERHIWVVPSAGGEPHVLAHPEGAGSDSGARWSTDSKSIRFTHISALGATAPYVADVTGGGEPRVAGPVRPSRFEELGIVPEVVRYPGKDGLPLAGILYRPVGYKPGVRYATVILPHGGPEGQVTLSASAWSIFLADQGYVVFEPNFRGSTGYGERFRNANVEDSGGGEIDDIQASVDYLVGIGITDPKRVGISGGSHGGTVVANAVTKLPDTFAVGIEKFGVVDRALFLRYTNRNSEIRWETKMGGPPALKPAVYRKANVLPDVAQIKAPLLILHGEEDPQVPPQESQEFAAALKNAGKTFTYITYPHEGHGLQQRDHRKDAYERELAFLNKYLRPDSTQ
jgi:dipeptidyl aminopeptidase/acylaminoacyl peptidase